jgi:hypothetical protein
MSHSVNHSENSGASAPRETSSQQAFSEPSTHKEPIAYSAPQVEHSTPVSGSSVGSAWSSDNPTPSNRE